MFERADVVEWLLNRGVNANIPDAEGYFPLHMAVIVGIGEPQRQLRIMRSLLDHGAAVDPTDKNGITPLQAALRRPDSRHG